MLTFHGDPEADTYLSQTNPNRPKFGDTLRSHQETKTTATKQQNRQTTTKTRPRKNEEDNNAKDMNSIMVSDGNWFLNLGFIFSI
jgi:hypothetical protein